MYLGQICDVNEKTNIEPGHTVKYTDNGYSLMPKGDIVHVDATPSAVTKLRALTS